MMPDKAASQEPGPKTPEPTDAFHPFAPLGWMSTAWIESLADLGSEATSFLAERIRQDVKTQHAILHCKSPAELQHLQAEFMQRAFDQYAAETGKLIMISAEIAEKIKDGSKRT
jgi:hypothetical protein